jgi:lactate dehydrogenase-like 2-hydroxyacid dehydrogenase
MKPEILQLSPILIPAVRDQLEALYTVRRYYEQADKPAYLREHGANIRGVVTGGHTGITREVMEQLPQLEVVAVNGVGTDAVDLAYARDRGIIVTATIGALTEDVADRSRPVGASARPTATCATIFGTRARRRWHRFPWRGSSVACGSGLSVWAG